METTLLTASFLRAWYPQRYPTSPHLCQSDAVKYFRCQKGLLPLSSFWRKALDKSFDRKDDNGIFAITSGSTIKCVTVVTAQAACPAAAYAFEYAAAFSFQQPPMLVRCCFSKRMRKLFRKNEKSVLRFCNKSSKTKRAFTKVLMPCKRPF